MLRSLAFLRGVPSLNTDAPGAAPPDAFGPFRVLHQIGAGALGPVFRAYQPEQDRLVAVKWFRLDLPPDRAHQLVAEFERLIAADLSHPGMAAPLATGIAGVHAFLAQDFVAAESLDVVIRDSGPASLETVVRVATQLGSALDHAAAAQVHHGALHPRDVLLSADDVRMTGFGVTRAMAQVGTVAPIRRPYTAPERVAGLPWDHRADIFSLGALLFELLTGRRVSGVGDDATGGLPHVIAGIEREVFRPFFAKALSGNPTGRFESGAALAQALTDALGSARPAPRRESTRRRKFGADSAPSLLPPPDPEPDEWPARSSVAPAAAPDPGPPPARMLTYEPEDAERDFDFGARAVAPDAPDIHLERTPPAHEPLALDLAEEPLALNLADEPLALDVADEPPRLPIVVEERDDVVIARHAGDDDVPLRRFAAVTPEPMPLLVEEPEASVGEMLLADPEEQAPFEIEHGEHGGEHVEHVDRMRPRFPEAARTFETEDAVETRRAIWPLVAALVVGIGIGFGSAFVLIERNSAPVSGQSEQSAAVRPATPVVEPSVQPVTDATPTVRPDAPSATAPAAPAAAAPADGAVRPPVSAPAPEPPVLSEPARPAPSGSGFQVPGSGFQVPGSAAPASPAAPARPAPAAVEGRLLVRSAPAGATVFIDGKAAGVTPLTERDLSRGAHTVRVHRDGYQNEERRVTITEARPSQTLTFDLERVRPAARPAARAAAPAPPKTGRGSLRIDSRPAGAQVFLDGKLVGRTPLVLDSVASGDHPVYLELDGYRRWADTASVTPGEQKRVAASLER